MVKNLPAKEEMLVQSLGQEDPLEMEMATHASTLAWDTSIIVNKAEIDVFLELSCFFHDPADVGSQTLFFWAPKSLQMVIAAMKLNAYSLEGKL